jgi:uridine phosphorylase
MTEITAETVQPLTLIPNTELTLRVVVVGDPQRAQLASALLDNAEQIAHNREYASWRGKWKGVPVSVVSHGVGAAGAAVCFTELCRAGARAIVRCGTAGGLAPQVQDGSLVVATGAVRCDGLTDQLVPTAYPAIADLALTQLLVDAAASVSHDTHVGVVATTAAFYPSGLLPAQSELWRDAGAVAVEMEAAALFIVGSLNRVACGAVLAIDGNPLTEQDTDMAGYDPHREIVAQAVANALTVALDAVTAYQVTAVEASASQKPTSASEG